jgi:hypothetical protein
MRFHQAHADELDDLLLNQPLPATATDALTAWLSDPRRGARYAHGTGPHAVRCFPSRWLAVTPWPTAFPNQAAPVPALVSRADAVAVASAAAHSDDWTQAFVASQVWGHGPIGYGPTRTAAILAHPAAASALAEAPPLLRTGNVTAAYERLNAVPDLGPAFSTKFLYFAAQALPETPEPRPLILDSVLARVLRRYVTRLGHESGLPWSAPIAQRIWAAGNWSPHRYSVYLAWMSATTAHLAHDLPGWPASPDVLELALFTGAWDPAAT